MASQERKVKAGKILMLISFIHVVTLLPGLPNPINVLMGLEAMAISISGLIGFLVFVLGYELWERNRIDINDI